LADGQTLADLMNTRLLVVTYTVTTKSMPPQTSPDSVVIMYEQAVTLPADVAPPVSPAPSTDFQGYFQLTDPTVSADSGFSMISQDGALVINIGDDTPITFDDGLPVRGNLADGQTLSDMLNNRNLDITYTVATASLPPQTTPDSIVVMYEKAVPLPETVVSPLDGSIAVLGDLIDAPAPYISDDGVIMVPLRAIAEKLGFDVVWDGTDQSVRLGKAVNLAIGKDYYTVGKMAPIQLGTAPELKDDRTYVPLSFFSTITAEYSAYCSFTGQIIIELADGAGSGVPDGAVN
ncbi:MAG: copper amine oxidase N-terminal domain-containing protein, partial [Defluviitaleaceae bacterium]|nr:copper amine oxidase N-terminal domain-containing protein [Defluviitaleaceae bacterium]